MTFSLNSDSATVEIPVICVDTFDCWIRPSQALPSAPLSGLTATATRRPAAAGEWRRRRDSGADGTGLFVQPYKQDAAYDPVKTEVVVKAVRRVAELALIRTLPEGGARPSSSRAAQGNVVGVGLGRSVR